MNRAPAPELLGPPSSGATEVLGKFPFGWGSAPDPTGGAYSAPSDPLAGFWQQLRGRGGAGLGKRRESVREGEGGGSGREGKGGPKVTVESGPSEPCYATGNSDILDHLYLARLC